MAQMLADNPEALLHHLGIENDVADSDNNPIPPGAQVVSVTEEERAAIERASIIYHP
jgi:UV excision repair protein RAD23